MIFTSKVGDIYEYSRENAALHPDGVDHVALVVHHTDRPLTHLTQHHPVTGTRQSESISYEHTELGHP